MRKLFVAQLLAGLAMLSWGLFVVPALPYVMLDVALTPNELQDQVKIAETLLILKKGRTHEMFVCIVAGLFVAATSIAGLRLQQAGDNAG